MIIMYNETSRASSNHHKEFEIDGGTITTIFLFVVISANLILTIHFYLSWRKGQITKHLSTGIERKSCASFRYQTDSQNEKDDVYADIRESYFTNTQRGTYKYIDPEFKGRNTYRELKLKSTRRERNKDGRNRNGRDRDKLQALNSFCARNLQDVDKSKSEEILTE